MKVPVSWDLTATLTTGLVWFNDAAAAAQENAYAPFGGNANLPPAGWKRVYLTGFHLVASAAGGGCTIGVFNCTTDTYTAKYTVNATNIASGGAVAGGPIDPIMVQMDLFDPANPTHVIVPAVQLLVGGTVNISGDLQFTTVPLTGDELGAILLVSQLNQLEEDATFQLDEDSTNQLEEQP